MNIQTDILYNQDKQLAYDLYVGDNHRHALIIVLHGGGWFHGDKHKDEDIATRFANAGYTVVVPNYSLAPEYHYPTPIDDLAFFFENAFLTQFDVQSLGVFGSSAGGNLAVELGLKYQVPVVSWSGVFDFVDWLSTHEDVVAENDTNQDFTATPSDQIDQSGRDDKFYKWFVTNYVADKTTEADILKREITDVPPMYLVNSTDELVPFDTIYKLALKFSKTTNAIYTQMIPGSKHAKGYMKQAWNQTLSFFDQYL
jgi:acetyl esterase/lipase